MKSGFDRWSAVQILTRLQPSVSQVDSLNRLDWRLLSASRDAIILQKQDCEPIQSTENRENFSDF